jgi:hypothetical protein
LNYDEKLLSPNLIGGFGGSDGLAFGGWEGLVALKSLLNLKTAL